MMIDDLFSERNAHKHLVDIAPDEGAPVAGLLQEIRNAPVFNLRGLVQAYERQVTDNGFRFIDSVHNVRMPFPRMWCEFIVPRAQINDKDVRMGAYLECFEKSVQNVPRACLVAERRKDANNNIEMEYLSGKRELEDIPNCILITATLIVEAEDVYFVLPRLVYVVADKLGVPITVPISPMRPLQLPFQMRNPQTAQKFQELREMVGSRANILWFATTLWNCKNVHHSLVKHDEKLQRARQRRGNAPLRDYYVLNVELPRERKAGNDGKSRQGSDFRRFHDVPGHLADYREGKGLFGKYHGMYWIPAHVRGNAERGKTNKSYSLHAKAQQ